MLKLKKLKFSGIGRFVESQTIEFDSLGNLIQVDGQNNNTGGSSGSGKSTVFNALDFLLGLNDLPITVLQSRLTKDPIFVNGEFDYDGQQLSITRNKKGLTIDLNGDITEGSSKLAEEKLDAILGMSRDLFRKILHKRQKEGGFFLDFTPKKMYEFMTDCLNLGDLNKKLAIVDKKISELTFNKTLNENDLSKAQSSLRATQDSILAIGLAPVKDIHKEVILELKEKYDAATVRLNEVISRHSQETKDLEQARPTIAGSGYDGSARNDLERRRKEIEAEISKCHLEEKERQAKIKASISEKDLERSKITYQINEGTRAKNEATRIALEIKQIRDCQCPTCKQSWTTESAKVTENDLLTKLSQYKEMIALAAAAADKKATLDMETVELHGLLIPTNKERLLELDSLEWNITEQITAEIKKAEEYTDKQNAANKEILTAFYAQMTAQRSQHALELEQARGQMDVDRRAFEAAVGKLKAYEEARIRYETALKTMKDNENTYLINIDFSKSQLSKIETELLMAEELKKALKTFTSCSFDEALETIGDSATRIIRCIPNMKNSTIQFDGQKETKEGKIKEEINAILSVDGEVGIPIKSLSGGERSSVDLAVDLAVIDFIENKTNKGIDLMILDEPFTGLDSANVEMILELLKNLNFNKRLIMVDHSAEVKEMVTSRIIVCREGEISQIYGI